LTLISIAQDTDCREVIFPRQGRSKARRLTLPKVMCMLLGIRGCPATEWDCTPCRAGVDGL